MADNENKGSNDKAIQPVCNLNVSSIISALHQNALQKALSKNKNVDIINSAVSDDGKIASAGEHVISVVPKKESPVLQKKDAIEVLKIYVQWFVGPDLASKVNDATVKSLTEDPLKESRLVMTFKDFLKESTMTSLIEATDEDDSSDEEEADASSDEEEEDEGYDEEDVDDVVDKGDEDEGSDEDGEDLVDEEPDPEKEKIESKAGYYIAYNLKVEGLPQTALKDALKKFAATFFDKVTFTSTSIFGGSGGSFTIKDVKDKLKDMFGAIDPEKLKSTIQDKIRTKYPDIANSADVDIRDKDTLLNDIDDQLDANQKQMINDANYSVCIKLEEHDPKKPILNPRLIADIVTSSITGLYKKFKHKITKNDVIYIPGFMDTSDKAEKIENLYKTVPSIEELDNEINKAQNATKLVATLIKKFSTIKKNPVYDKSPRAQQCVKVWDDYLNSIKGKDGNIDYSKIDYKDKKGSFITNFFDKYKKEYNDTKDDKLEESNHLIYILSYDKIKQSILESIMPNISNLIYEADDISDDSDDAEEAEDTTIKLSDDSLTDISKILNLYGKEDFPKNSIPNIVASTKEQLEKKYTDYANIAQALNNVNYAIVFEFNNKDIVVNEVETNNVKDDIIRILFDDGLDSKINTILNEKSNTKTKTDTSNKKQLNNKIYLQLIKDFIKNGINNNDKINAVANENKITQLYLHDPNKLSNIFVVPFDPKHKDEDAKENTSNTADSDTNDNLSDNDNNKSKGKEDLYIIPMKGLKYKDDEE